VRHALPGAIQACSRRELQHAAGIRGNDERGFGCCYEFHFALQNLISHLILDDVVDAGASAA